ncbi:MAG TPA: cyanophycinase [Candidatus Thermoplasmatota archaeon]|nr:cyanophycinase [Candidatus Thermoplasmatota archaeon]
MTLGFRSKPKGTLVPVGGNEDKQKGLHVLRRICSLPDGGTKIVEVIPTASSEPKETADQYLQAFSRIGIPTVRVMNIQSRAEAHDEALVERIREADVVFMTGGDQLRLAHLLGGTPVCEAIKRHYHNGGVVAGTSAGAAAMSSTMIFEGEAGVVHKGNVRMTPGLGLIETAVVDTHFVARGRFTRLIEVVAGNPGYVGMGVGEDTGVIIRDGHLLEVFGGGVVVIIDGHHLQYSNISAIEMGAPIAAEHIVLHTLVEGCGYDLDEQRFIPPKGTKETVKAAKDAKDTKTAKEATP